MNSIKNMANVLASLESKTAEEDSKEDVEIELDVKCSLMNVPMTVSVRGWGTKNWKMVSYNNITLKALREGLKTGKIRIGYFNEPTVKEVEEELNRQIVHQ
jgi:hypothetical protein